MIGFLRRTTAGMVGMAVVASVPIVLSTMASAEGVPVASTSVDLAVAVTNGNCRATPNAIAAYRFDPNSGHALSGTWTVAPKVTCDVGKTKITVNTILRRNHSAQLSSAGSCTAGLRGLCSSAAGPRRQRSYGTTIRGTWDAVTSMGLSGPDVRSYARTDPTHCHYRTPMLTTTCTYVSKTLIIR
jgi:hypothetical protein